MSAFIVGCLVALTGGLVLIAVLVWALLHLTDYISRVLGLMWEFTWFVFWRARHRRQDPTLTDQLKEALARGDRAVAKAERARIEAAKECWNRVYAIQCGRDGRILSDGKYEAMCRITDYVKELEAQK